MLGTDRRTGARRSLRQRRAPGRSVGSKAPCSSVHSRVERSFLRDVVIFTSAPARVEASFPERIRSSPSFPYLN